MSSTKYEVGKFCGKGKFSLWQRRMKDLLIQQGVHKALLGKAKKPEKMSDENWEEMDEKAASAIRLNLVNLEEEDKAIFLLASLPTSFNHLVTMLMHGNDTLELEEVTSALLSHSKMKQDGDDSQGDGLVVHSKSNRSRKKSRGSNSNNERSQSKSCVKKDIECFYCHKKGHYKNQCKELKQHLEERKNEKKAVESTSVVEEKSDDSEIDGDLLSVS
uniref:CCHC-type domain-containing protein n=1 Tax=Fagus sylvatica TaxID=28930 RepID=A0A2N9IT84_FAGSY